MIRTKLLKRPGIYSITSKINGKFYIGSAVNLASRKYEHLKKLKRNTHPNRHLQNHFNKYTEDDFIFSTICFCEKEKLIETEQFYLDSLKPHFNICKIASSTLGIRYTEKQKDQWRGENSKSKLPEVREKFRLAWKNRLPDSKETKERKRIAVQGKNNPRYGVTLSEETKRKISESQKGEKSAWWGKKHSENTILKMKDHIKNRPIKCCIYCGFSSTNYGIIERWHNNNCKAIKMNDEEILIKLRKLTKVMFCSRKPPTHEGTFARVTEEGLFTFGTRKPLTRNTVTKAIAIWIILQKLPK